MKQKSILFNLLVKNKTVIYVFIIGILASIFFYNQMSIHLKNTNKKEFLHLLKRQTSAIQRELDTNLQVLKSLQSFYNSSTYISRKEFKKFVEQSLREHKSLQALSWVPKVLNKDKEVYLLKTRKEIGNAFIIKEKASTGGMKDVRTKEEYFPVDYIEPIEGNKKAQGFDLSSNKTRLETLNYARNNNSITATARIKLVQEKGTQFGFLVIAPIWDKKDSRNLEGFYSAVFRAGDMVTTALQIDKLDSSMLDLWLLDTTNKNKQELLFTNTSLKKANTTKDFLEINIQGRAWTMYASPSEIFINATKSVLPMSILIFGLLVTGLVSYIIFTKISRAAELERIVNKKTEHLRKSNRKYETLLNMFDKKVIASRTDLKGTITYATTAFEQISGYTKEELIGVNHNILRHPDMPKQLYSDLWNTIKEGKTFSSEIKNKRKDGTSYWVKIVILPEYDENQKIIGYFAVRDDITDKKKVIELNNTLSEKIESAVFDNQKKDQLLLEQSKLAAMGEMIGAIAHQWRQPLNSLALKIQFIEDDYEDKLINKEYINEYSKESMDLINFMSKTIDDFRNFFTVDKDKSLINVKIKIQDTINMIQAQLESHEINIKIHGQEFNILGFTSEFQQVILNLLSNAKDALVENNITKKEIFIELKQNNNNGYVIITDNAGGIPSQILNRIFEPYFTTKEEGKGTGLGLYMSKMIIEDNMKGKLSVKNSDKGAEFIIELEVSK